MSNIAIKSQNISKQYRLGEIGTGTISHDLNRWVNKVFGKEDKYLKIDEVNDRTTRGGSDYVWSLKDINFEILEGDAVGVIGRNGAGKSTLLKLLSKVTKPTTGSFLINGKIASLLEVGTGFHPEMTGRENIFLNGAILGMQKAEIKKKFDEIVDFSGVEKYVDTPVKRYSSGMYVRLAFAVAAHLEPDILIVDEVLAVGDAEFQKKCLGKMQDSTKNSGRTILFVSHNMGAIQTLCNKGIYLKNGRLVYQGDVDNAINSYMHDINIPTQDEIANRTDRQGNGKIRVTKVSFLNKENYFINEILAGEYLRIQINYENKNEIDVSKLIVAIKFFDPHEQPICFWVSDEMNHAFQSEGENSFSLIIPKLNLRPGQYTIGFQISINDTNASSFCDVMSSAKTINILSNDFFHSGFFIRESYSSLIQAKFSNI